MVVILHTRIAPGPCARCPPEAENIGKAPGQSRLKIVEYPLMLGCMKRISGINAVLVAIVLSLVVMTWRSLQPPRSDDDPKKREQTEKTADGSPYIDTQSTAKTNPRPEKRSPGGRRLSNRFSPSPESGPSRNSDAARSSGLLFDRPISENGTARIPIPGDGAEANGDSERLVEEFRTARSRLRSG